METAKGDALLSTVSWTGVLLTAEGPPTDHDKEAEALPAAEQDNKAMEIAQVPALPAA